jgi:hypothetical protein
MPSAEQTTAQPPDGSNGDATAAPRYSANQARTSRAVCEGCVATACSSIEGRRSEAYFASARSASLMPAETSMSAGKVFKVAAASRSL